MKQKKNIKQIFALIGVCVLVAMYLITFVLAFFTKKGYGNWFKASVILTIALPIGIWVLGILMGKISIFNKPEVKEEQEEIKIKNVIFDIGNVLTNYRWREYLVDKGYDEAMVERIANASVKNPGWNEFDRGVYTEEEIIQMFVDSDPEIEDIIRDTFRNISGLVTKRDFAIPWVEELKDRGLKCYYLSNFSKKAVDECSEAIDFIPHMDGGILSYREKMIKPEPGIYKLLLDRYSLVPQESVFIDDLEANIKGAEAFGINGIVFKSLDQAKEELKSMGVY